MRRSHLLLDKLCVFVVLACSLGLLAPGCRLIDEDRSDCPEDLTIIYTLKLITNLETECDDKLGSVKDRPLREALEDYLKDIFVDLAHDVDLSFYDIEEPGVRAVHRAEIMDAGQATYEITLPARDYMHLGIANMAGERSVSLTGDVYSGTSTLLQNIANHVPSHNTGLFTAREAMKVLQGVDQTFEVNLYMANDAGALIVHRDSCKVQKMWMEVEGLGDRFLVRDSVYKYSHAVIDADYIDAQPWVDKYKESAKPATKAGQFASDYDTWTVTPGILCGVGFSSRDAGKATMRTSSGDEVLWVVHLYVTLENGSTTRSTIYVGEPLPAGHLKIIRGWLKGDGSFVPGPPVPGGGDDMVVGVSVTLDWQEGPTFEPVL